MGYAAGKVGPSGKLGLQIVRKDGWLPEALGRFTPRSQLGLYLKELLTNHGLKLPREAVLELIDRVASTTIVESSLRARHVLANWRDRHDYGVPVPFVDFGVVCVKVVTTTGVNAIVDAFQNTVELETFKYHGLGTGTTSPVIGDTALETELTTQYNPDGTRATGTTTEGAGANIYRSVGTNTVDASAAVTEHGIFSAASAGTLLDRFTFAVINLGNGDGLETTFDLTFTAGS